MNKDLAIVLVDMLEATLRDDFPATEADVVVKAVSDILYKYANDKL